MPVNDVSRTVWCGDVVDRSIAQHTIGVVEASGCLLERHGRSDESVLERTIPMIADRIAGQSAGLRGSGHESSPGQASDQQEAGCQCHPSASEAAMALECCRIQPIPKCCQKLRSRLEPWRPVERRSKRLSHSAPPFDLDPARRAALEMPEDFMIRFRDELLSQKRVGELTYITTAHDGSVSPSRVFVRSSCVAPDRQGQIG